MSQAQDLETIMDMLTYCRPAGSQSEMEFIKKFLGPLGVRTDKFGNCFLRIGESPSVLWSSHTDTVHHMDGRQAVVQDGGYIRLSPHSKSNCLGSDCAAGVWIMMEMIKAKVPGLYVFHAQEETGCHGSKFILNKTPKMLSSIKAAVAFDRRDVNHVITHQGNRCCSDAFGLSIADQLPLRFKLNDGGFVTDTKMYMNVVPECSNISVGYYDEHHPSERLDFAHLIELRDHMVKIDQSKFVIKRDPKQIEMKMEKPQQKRAPSIDQELSERESQARSLRHFFRRPRPDYPESLTDLAWNYTTDLVLALHRMGVTYEDVMFEIEEGRFDTELDRAA